MVQPCRPPVWLLLVAWVSCRTVQLSPPSVERENSTGSDPATPRKPTLHTYTFPKCALDEALSAHSCSLSLNSAEFCLVTTTGAIQASLSPAIAPARSSERDTAIAAAPLNGSCPGTVVAMLA